MTKICHKLLNEIYEGCCVAKTEIYVLYNFKIKCYLSAVLSWRHLPVDFSGESKPNWNMLHIFVVWRESLDGSDSFWEVIGKTGTRWKQVQFILWNKVLDNLKIYFDLISWSHGSWFSENTLKVTSFFFNIFNFIKQIIWRQLRSLFALICF